MAFTKVAPAGIGSTPGDGYRIGDSFLHSTGVDITNINATGIVTAASLDISGAIDFDGHTELDNVNISGVSTFAGNIDANGDLDVDGHTNLDNVSVSGVSTFSGIVAAGVGSTAITLDNSHKMTFGSANELEMYHDGSQSYIKQRYIAYPSNLNIISENSSINIMSGSGGNAHGGYENAIQCLNNGAVKLYHAGVGPHLETNGGGITVQGNIQLGDKLIHNGDTDTCVRFPTHNTISFETTGSERLRIDSNGRLLVGATSTSASVRAVFQGYHGGGDDYQARVQFQTNQATNLAVNQHLANLLFTNSSGSVGAEIRAIADGAWGTNDYPGRLEFYTTPDGSNTSTERLRIDSSGQLIMTNATTQTFADFSTTNNTTRGLISLAGKDGSGNAVTLKMGGFGDTSRGEIFTHSNHGLGFATNNAATQMMLNTSGSFIVGSTTYGAAGSFSVGANGTFRSILASGTAQDTLIAGISGVSNGFQITTDTSNNQTYKFHSGTSQAVTIKDNKLGVLIGSPFNRFQCGGHTFTGGDAMYADNRVGMSNHGSLTGLMLASTYNDPTHPEYGLVFVQGPTTSSYNVWSVSPDGPAKGDSLNFHYGGYSGSGGRPNIHVPSLKKFEMNGDGNFHITAGNLKFANGYGVDFSATGNSGGTMTSELLHDYEEGTFTPTIIRSSAGYSGNYNYQHGVYTRIGRLVHCYIDVDINNFSGGGGHVGMSGLPYTVSSHGLPGWPHSMHMARMYLDGDYAAGVDARTIRFSGTNYGYVMNIDDDTWDYGNYTRVIFTGSFTFMVS